MSDLLATGWLPELELPAREAWAKSGQPFAFGAAAIAEDTRPLPAAFSLSQYVRWYYNQGAVGSCSANSGCQAFQTHTAADNADGQEWEEHQLSRAFLWYEARRRDGLLGKGEGASCTNTMRALDEAGCPPEADWPYRPEYRWLERKPSVETYSRAVDNQLTGVVDAELGDQARRLIMNGHALQLGIPWPGGWDTAIGPDGRATGIGRVAGGHALCVDSYILAGVWDRHAYWGINNSHGPIYHPLTPALAAPVVGYKPARPDRDYRFWVRDDMVREVMGRGYSELIAPAGMTGFKVRPKLLEWGGLLS